MAIPSKPVRSTGKDMSKALDKLSSPELVVYGFHGSEAIHNALAILKMNCKPLSNDLKLALGAKTKKVSTGPLIVEAFNDLLANYLAGRGMLQLRSVDAVQAWLDAAGVNVMDSWEWPNGLAGCTNFESKTVFIPAYMPESIKLAIAELPGMVRPLTDDAREQLGARFNSISSKLLLDEALYWLAVKYATGKGNLPVRNVESLKAQLLTIGLFTEADLKKVK